MGVIISGTKYPKPMIKREREWRLELEREISLFNACLGKRGGL